MYVIQEVGFDPYSAWLADIIDEVEKSKGTKHRVTMEEVAGRVNVPVKDLYNYKRRLKYRKGHSC